MNTDQQSAEVEALIADFTDLVRTDTLIGRADRFLHDADGVVASLHEMGYVPVPRDPLKGRAPEPTADPSLYYTMFWRMFDKTPASMVQSLAIPLRRILAQRIFKRCGEGVIFHHNVLF